MSRKRTLVCGGVVSRKRIQVCSIYKRTLVHGGVVNRNRILVCEGVVSRKRTILWG